METHCTQSKGYIVQYNLHIMPSKRQNIQSNFKVPCLTEIMCTPTFKACSVAVIVHSIIESLFILLTKVVNPA